MPRSALRLASSLPLEKEVVAGCLNLEKELDRRFATAWRETLVALPPALRSGALPGVTGHVAESVVEVVLGERGYAPLAHHVGPGRHGVDLIMLHVPSELVFVIEVKGTLRQQHVPRLTRGDLAQMSTAWLNKPDNPAMSGTDLRSDDVYAAVVAVNFADMTIRAAMSADLTAFVPVENSGQLDDPSWLAPSGRR